MTARACAILVATLALLMPVCGHAQSETSPSTATTDTTAGEAAPPASDGALGLLELMDLGPAQLAELADGSAVSDNERPLLYRLLTALPRFTLTELHDWAKEVPWNELLTQPGDYRGQLFELAGRVEQVTAEHLPPELADRYPIGESSLEVYYRCQVKLGEDERPAILYALKVPSRWKLGATIDQRIGARALFMKLAGDSSDDPLPVFVAKRVAWYPDSELGDLEMDVGLFDEVDNRQRLTGADRQAFYELLAAVGRAGTNELLSRTNRHYSVAPLFNDPDAQQGKLFALTGTARRAVLVRVEDPEIKKLYGIDHYYEIELITNDSQGNPVTFCVRQLPEGMPTGEDMMADVRIAGAFFKTWAYRRASGASDEESGKIMRQFAPLLIGREPVLIKREPPSALVNTIATVLFLVGIVGFWLGVWWLNRSDRRFRRTIASRYEPEGEVSLDQLGLEDSGPVRFENGE